MKRWNVRKLAALLLALSMLPSLLLLPTAAAGPTDYLVASVTYPVKGGQLTFNPNTGMIISCSEYVTVAEIPSEINGVPVTGIGEEAFAGTYQLKRLTIPDSVILIEDYAFDECYYLSSVVYTGTMEQWYEIYIGYGNECLKEADITFAGEGGGDPYDGGCGTDPYDGGSDPDPYDGGSDPDPYDGGSDPDPYDGGSDPDPYDGGDQQPSDPAGPNPFTDVKAEDYFYDAVQWAYYANPQITNGMDDTHFVPSSTVTRGQCVTFLWRSQGCPEPSTARNPFSDVPSGQYYYKAVLWAVEQGITNGTDASHFSPNQTLSTAHITTFLYRTLGIGSDGWYQEAANWATKQNLLLGMNLMVAPGVDCPRGAVVTLLYRQLGRA